MHLWCRSRDTILGKRNAALAFSAVTTDPRLPTTHLWLCSIQARLEVSVGGEARGPVSTISDAQLLEQIATLQKQLDTNKLAHQREVETQALAGTHVQSKLDAANAEVQSLRDDLLMANSQAGSTVIAPNNGAEITKLQSQVEVLTLELGIAKQDSAGVAENIVALQDERDQADKQVAVLQQEIDAMQTGGAANAAGPSTSSEAQAALLDSLNTAQRECTALRAQVADLEAIAATASDGGAPAAVAAGSSEEIAELKQANAEAMDAVMDKISERDAAIAEASALQQQLEALNEGLEGLSAERDNAMREASAAIQELEVLRSAPPPVPPPLSDDDASAEEIVNLQAQLGDAMEAVMDKAAERDRAIAERDELQQQLDAYGSEAESEMSKLRAEAEMAREETLREAQQQAAAMSAVAESEERLRAAEQHAAAAAQREAALLAQQQRDRDAAERQERDAAEAEQARKDHEAAAAAEQARREAAIKAMEAKTADRADAPAPPVAPKLKAPVAPPADGTDLDDGGEPVVMRRPKNQSAGDNELQKMFNRRSVRRPKTQVEASPPKEGAANALADGFTEKTAMDRANIFEDRARSQSVSSSPGDKSPSPLKRGGKGGASFKSSFRQSNTQKCLVCNKSVYPVEKIEADGKVYHKACFRCAICKKTVNLGSYAALEGLIYCKPHIKQLFLEKGNYDEGFGRETHKKKWTKGMDGSGESSDA